MVVGGPNQRNDFRGMFVFLPLLKNGVGVLAKVEKESS